MLACLYHTHLLYSQLRSRQLHIHKETWIPPLPVNHTQSQARGFPPCAHASLSPSKLLQAPPSPCTFNLPSLENSPFLFYYLCLLASPRPQDRNLGWIDLFLLPLASQSSTSKPLSHYWFIYAFLFCIYSYVALTLASNHVVCMCHLLN